MLKGCPVVQPSPPSKESIPSVLLVVCVIAQKCIIFIIIMLQHWLGCTAGIGSLSLQVCIVELHEMNSLISRLLLALYSKSFSLLLTTSNIGIGTRAIGRSETNPSLELQSDLIQCLFQFSIPDSSRFQLCPGLTEVVL